MYLDLKIMIRIPLKSIENVITHIENFRLQRSRIVFNVLLGLFQYFLRALELLFLILTSKMHFHIHPRSTVTFITSLGLLKALIGQTKCSLAQTIHFGNLLKSIEIFRLKPRLLDSISTKSMSFMSSKVCLGQITKSCKSLRLF